VQDLVNNSPMMEKLTDILDEKRSSAPKLVHMKSPNGRTYIGVTLVQLDLLWKAFMYAKAMCCYDHVRQNNELEEHMKGVKWDLRNLLLKDQAPPS